MSSNAKYGSTGFYGISAKPDLLIYPHLILQVWLTKPCKQLLLSVEYTDLKLSHRCPSLVRHFAKALVSMVTSSIIKAWRQDLTSHYANRLFSDSLSKQPLHPFSCCISADIHLKRNHCLCVFFANSGMNARGSRR